MLGVSPERCATYISHMLVTDSTFVVVDTETTGGTPGHDRVIEIGAVKVRNGQVIDRFSQLINPERSIPWKITQLTGISTAMVFDQPLASEVLPSFVEFLGDGVFVAHNRTFDERFINAELNRLGLGPMHNRMLCTLRLARRVLRGLRSKGLSSLADHYQIKISNRHRALGDADATAIVLNRLIESLSFEHGIKSLEELIAFQGESYSSRGRDASRHVLRIRSEVLPRLPEASGVYFMYDRNGRIIYVGKAKNLRSRVRSYFSAIEAHPPRTRKLLRDVRDVSWKETGSELAALLEESRLIKSHQPRHNRALKRFGRRPFIKLESGSRFPRVSSSHFLIDDGAEYFGPVAGNRYAAFIVELINHRFGLRQCTDQTLSLGQPCLYADMGSCLAPCTGGAAVEAYEEEVRRVRRFLLGQDETVIEDLENEMREAAARLDFEEAGRYRDWVQVLRQTFATQRAVADSVLEHNAVLVQPGADPSSKQLFFVRFGRYVYNVSVSTTPDARQKQLLSNAIRTFFDANQLRPARYDKSEVDEIRILLNWMHANRNATQTVHWAVGEPTAAFTTRVLAQIEPSEQSQMAHSQTRTRIAV